MIEKEKKTEPAWSFIPLNGNSDLPKKTIFGRLFSWQTEMQILVFDIYILPILLLIKQKINRIKSVENVREIYLFCDIY